MFFPGFIVEFLCKANYIYSMRKYINKFSPTLLCAFLISFAILPQKIFSADFSIAPVRVFFDTRTTTAILTITNESEKDLTLQLKTFTWQQDEAGEDVYSPTEDIIFFPKIFKIEKAADKLIRLWSKIPHGSDEKTYRLFLEEIPESQAANGASVRILMRVGVPIFISPLQESAKGVITKAVLQSGNLSLSIKNEGNSHFIIQKITVKGTNDAGIELFNIETGGGYLLAAASKSFMIEIPADKCPQAKFFEINIDTDKLSLDGKIEISKEMCRF